MKSILRSILDMLKAALKLVRTFIRLLFKAVYLSLRNRIYKLLARFLMSKYFLFLAKIYYSTKWVIPYNRAKVCMAYRLYEGSELYRQRCIQVNPHFAEESFITCKGYNYFRHKLTKMDKLKALVIPFNYCSPPQED